MIKQFHFDLTCDVTDDPEVNQICCSSMNFPGLSIAVFAFPIRCVVSELRGGGAQNDPPAAGGWRGGPAAAGLIYQCNASFISRLLILLNFTSLSQPETLLFQRLRLRQIAPAPAPTPDLHLWCIGNVSRQNKTKFILFSV